RGFRTSWRFGGQRVGTEAPKRLNLPAHAPPRTNKTALRDPAASEDITARNATLALGFRGERTGRRRMVQRGLSWKGFSARPAAAFASLPPWLLSASGVAAAPPSRGCAYITARRVLVPRVLGSRGRGAPRDRDAAGTSATGPRPAGQAEEREQRREEGAGGGGGEGRPATPPAMMPGQIPDPSVTAGSLPGLGPLTGLPSSALTTEELKYADIRNIGAMIAPLHFLEVKLGKRPQPVKSEVRPLFSRQSPGFRAAALWAQRQLEQLTCASQGKASHAPRTDIQMFPSREAIGVCYLQTLWIHGNMDGDTDKQQADVYMEKVKAIHEKLLERNRQGQ
ncbi:hypothetical protein A6R68_16080, partial [Neotoma lepida]